MAQRRRHHKPRDIKDREKSDSDNEIQVGKVSSVQIPTNISIGSTSQPIVCNSARSLYIYHSKPETPVILPKESNNTYTELQLRDLIQEMGNSTVKLKLKDDQLLHFAKHMCPSSKDYQKFKT